jgi:hypothetical protein
MDSKIPCIYGAESWKARFLLRDCLIQVPVDTIDQTYVLRNVLRTD